MTPELSKDEIAMLQAMWAYRALASSPVTTEQLSRRLSGLPREKLVEALKCLEARALVTVTNNDNKTLFALSPLGAACSRQLVDNELGDLTGGV